VYSDDVNRADFKKLALTRLNDAKILLNKKRYSAAYYVAGYVIECALKACLAKKARRYEFPPRPDEVRKSYYTHDLQELARASDLLEVLEKGRSNLKRYWTTVKDWSGASRYDPNAGKLAKDILLAIEDPTDGVLQCIKRYW
jgi:HEPN domain-containing protein